MIYLVGRSSANQQQLYSILDVRKYLFQVQWYTVNAFVGTGQCLTPILTLTPITGHRYSISNDCGGGDSDDDDDVGDDVDDNGRSVDDTEVLPVQRQQLVNVELHSLATFVMNSEFDTAIEVEQRHTANWPCLQPVNQS